MILKRFPLSTNSTILFTFSKVNCVSKKGIETLSIVIVIAIFLEQFSPRGEGGYEVNPM